MARRSNVSLKDPEAGGTSLVKGAALKPIRMVRRELTSPDGRTHEVEVPVYPPFRLETAEEKNARVLLEKKQAKGEKSEDEGAAASEAACAQATADSEGSADSESAESDGDEA